MIDSAFKDQCGHLSPRGEASLKAELEELIRKHYEHVAAPEMTLTLPQNLSEEQLACIRTNVKKAFRQYNEQMSRRLNEVFLDLYLARMEICELKHN